MQTVNDERAVWVAITGCDHASPCTHQGKIDEKGSYQSADTLPNSRNIYKESKYEVVNR